MIIKKLIYIFLLILLPFISSCSEDVTTTSSGSSNLASNEIPIDFNISLADTPMTRALEGAKTSFSTGDIIHISAKFKLNKNGVISEEIRYGALSYNRSTNKWNPVQGSELTWPSTSEDGVFTAYYIPTYDRSQGTTGGLITDNEPHISLLENVTLTSDPLFAETSEDTPVNYGNAVALRFSHLCTYLTLQDMRPAYDQFIFSTENIKESESASATFPFNNAFSITLNTDKTLSFEFCQSPEGQSEYTITSSTIKDATTGSGDVSFFLQPGFYEKFTVLYSTGGTNTKFLNFQYTPMQGTDDYPNTPPMLEAGTAYVLDTTQAPGIVIQSPSQEDDKPWDNDDIIITVDVDEFLTAISENKTYIKGDSTILEKTNNRLRLTHHVNFKDTVYTWLRNGSLPSVPTGETFDGDNRMIYNLGSPLFHENNGNIINLGLNHLNTSVVLNQNVQDPNHPNDHDFSRQGGLCRRNNGTINNILLTDFTIIASVIVENDSDNEDNQDTENLGLIAGSNTGTIEKVRLAGNFTVSAKTDDNDTNGSNCTINMGGLVGQNTDSGKINDIAAFDGKLQEIKVVNNCYGNMGAYYVGGVVGYNAGYIGAVGIPNIEVDCTASLSTKSFIGLIVGEITTSTNSSSTITSTNVAGSAKAGEIYVYNDLDSGSYLGGIAGASVKPNNSKGISVTDCMVIVNSLNNSKANKANVINGTGGCFGRIYANFNVNNILLTLNSISMPITPVEGLDYATGTFAGFTNSGFQWNWSSPNTLINNTTYSAAIGEIK